VGIELTYSEIDEIEYQMSEFLKWFYATFHQGKDVNLSVCKYTVHALSHLTENLRDWGAASYYWQYTEVFLPSKMIIIEGTIVRDSRRKCQKPSPWVCKSVDYYAST
jgi:hypothetical protein